MGYALSFYKMGVTVGGGLALVLGGMIYDFYLAQPSIEWPLLGELKPWQATLITAGLPGFVLCILMGTIQEPSRKGEAISKTSATDGQKSFPFMTVIRFMAAQKDSTACYFLVHPFYLSPITAALLGTQKCWRATTAYRKAKPAAPSE